MIAILNFDNNGNVSEKVAHWLKSLSPSYQAVLLDDRNSYYQGEEVLIDGHVIACPERISSETRGNCDDGYDIVWLFGSELGNVAPCLAELYYENRNWEAVELEYLDELDVENNYVEDAQEEEVDWNAIELEYLEDEEHQERLDLDLDPEFSDEF